MNWKGSVVGSSNRVRRRVHCFASFNRAAAVHCGKDPHFLEVLGTGAEERPKEVFRTFSSGVEDHCAEHLMCACLGVLHACSRRVQYWVPHFLQVFRTLLGEVFSTAV